MNWKYKCWVKTYLNPFIVNLIRTKHFSALLYILFFLFASPISATSMQFAGYVEEPGEGAYNQTISIRVLIIDIDFKASTSSRQEETIIWEKEYLEVPVHGGYFNLDLDIDDQNRQISDVFEAKVDYSFESLNFQDSVRRSEFPESNYALRIFMKTPDQLIYEQIKPDKPIDGFPVAISGIDLTGLQVKKGELTIIHSSGDPRDTGSVVTVDTLEGKDISSSYDELLYNQGVYLENTRLTIDMDPEQSNLAFDIQGTMYLKNSDLVLSGNLTLDRGNIFLNSLCLTEDCDGVDSQTLFNGELFAFRSVKFNQFEDLDDPLENTGFYAGTRYALNPGGESVFRDLIVKDLSPKINTLAFEDGSHLKLKGKSAIFFDGPKVNLSLDQGNISLNPDISDDGFLNHLAAPGMDLSRFRLLDTGIIDNLFAPEYKDDRFFKLKASLFARTIDRAFFDPLLVNRFQNNSLLPNEFAIKPSRNSKFQALQFYFENFDQAKITLDRRVERVRFPRSPNRAADRKASALFHPIFTEEILESLLSGNTTNLHNHDLVSQADAEEILQIINDPKFTDDTRIDYLKIDPELARLPDQNIWEKQNIFNSDGLALESGFLIKKDLITSYGPQGSSALNFQDRERVKVIFGDGPNHDFAYLGTIENHQDNQINTFELYNPLGLMDFRANSLNVHGSVKMAPPTTATSAVLDIWGELTVRGDAIIEGDLYSGGQTILGCFLSPKDCPAQSGVLANSLQNVNQLGGSIFKDLDDLSFLLNPNGISYFNDLKLKDDLVLKGSSILFENSLTSKNKLEAGNVVVGTRHFPGYSAAKIFLTTNAQFYSDPSSLSVWNSLELTDELEIGGGMDVLGEIKIGGVIEAQSATVSKESTFEEEIIAASFGDLDSIQGSSPPTAVLDPSALSSMNALELEGNLEMDGSLQVDGDLSLGSALTLNSNLVNLGIITAPHFSDEDNTFYVIDPNGYSTVNTLEVTSLLSTESLTAARLELEGELTAHQSASISGPLTVEGETLVRSEIFLRDTTGRIVFHVDEIGNLTARSVRFNSFVKITDFVDLLGLLRVFADVGLHDPSDFQGSAIRINKTFSIIDENNVPTFHVDSDGNIVSSGGGAQSTGAIHFLLSSAQMALLSHTWALGTNNGDVRKFSMEDAQGNGLNLSANQLSSISTATGSEDFNIAQNVKLQTFIDSDNHSFRSDLNGMSILNELAVQSTQSITIESNPLILPAFHDLEQPTLGIDPSGETTILDLNVDKLALLRSNLSIQVDPSESNQYANKLQILTALTTPSATALKIDNDLSISNQGALTASYSFDHTGKVELYRSVLELGSGTSVTSVNMETMTTLVILPPSSFNSTFQATFPEYFADHLHSHDQVAGVKAEQMAFRSQANILEGSNRFRAGEDSVVFQPSVSITPSWIRTNISNTQRYYPWVLPMAPSGGAFGQTTGSFLLAGGTQDLEQTNSNSTIMSFTPTGPDFSNLGNHTNLSNNFAPYSFSIEEGRIYHAGGIDSSGNLKDSLTYYSGSWNSFSLPNPVAYSQLEALEGSLYLFGGFEFKNNKVYEFEGNLETSVNRSTQFFTSDFPLNRQQRKRSLLYTRGNYLYRNTPELDREEVVYQHSSTIFKPSLSRSGIDICFHSQNGDLLVFNLVSGQVFDTSVDTTLCQWGPESEPDTIYYIEGTETYGKLAKIDRDGTSQGAIGALNSYDLRHFQILSGGSLNLVGQSLVAGVPGERFLVKNDQDLIYAIDSDGTDLQTILESSLNANYPQAYANQLYYLNSSTSSNSATNLFVAELDGSDRKQLTYFPQGINERPVFLDSGDALVAVDAFHVNSSKLPSTYEQGCSASYQDKLYLFGAGSSEDEILVYDTKDDTFETLLETLPFDTPFSCTYDESSKVYFQQGNTFWYYDLAQNRFWPLADISSAEIQAAGALAYSALTTSVYFLEERTSTDARFHQYSVSREEWSTKSSPEVIYQSASMLAITSKVFVFGNALDSDNRYFDLNQNQWITPGTSTSPISNMHSLSLLEINHEKILILSGISSSSTLSSAWTYQIEEDSFQTLPNLRSPGALAGVFYDSNQQIFMLGGDGTESQLQIYPLNTQSNDDFSQIMRVDLLSGDISHETSAPSFVHAARSPLSSDVVYFDPANGLVRYNPHTSAHTTLINNTSADDVTGIALAPENDWAYFSNLDGSTENIYRIALDGTGLVNLSSSSLSGVSGAVQLVSDDHERLYLITSDNRKPAQVAIHGETPLREIGSNEISQFGFYSKASVTELRDGVFYRTTIANLSSGALDLSPLEIREENEIEGVLLVQDVFEDSNGNFLISARRHHTTTNLYLLSDQRETAVALTSYSDKNTYAEAPHRFENQDRVYFTKTASGTTDLVMIEESVETQVSDSSIGMNSGNLFEPGNYRDRSFTFGKRIYSLTGNELHKTQVLSATASALDWSLHDVITQVDSNAWQITQFKNQIYFYDEENRHIFRYYPDEKALHFLSSISSAEETGVLAVAADPANESKEAFYHIGGGSVAKLDYLEQPKGNLSLEVLSAADANPEGAGEKILTIGTDGVFFARALSGTAIIDDGTISGGDGDHGILDGSLNADDFANSAITEEKLQREIFGGEHIQDSVITGVKISTNTLDGSHFQTGIIDSNEIGLRQIQSRHLSLSSIETSKIKSTSIENIDFADQSIDGEHIISDSLSGSAFASDSILARHIAFETLDTEEFLSKSLATEHILDGSLEHSDIATDQFESRHFQTGSATTEKITAAAVIDTTIASFTLRTDNFLNYTIETSDFASETIEGSNMVTGAIHSAHILDDISGIATQNLSDASLTHEKFATDSLDGEQIDTHAILSSDILQNTLTNRELGEGSIDSSKIENNTVEDSRLDSAAITIDKIADDALAEVDIEDGVIKDRHIEAGGEGDLITFDGFSFGSRSNTPMGFYEDQIYLAGGLKIDLHTKTTSSVSALSAIPLTASAFASTETTLYLFRNSTLQGFDYDSETLYTLSTQTFSNSNDAAAGGFIHNGDFYFIGGFGDHSQSFDRFDFSSNSWTNLQRPSIDLSGSEAISTGTTIMAFIGNEVHTYDVAEDSWATSSLGINFDFTGCDTVSYQGSIYLFGGKSDHSAIFRYEIDSKSITQLTSQSLEIGSLSGGTNQVLLTQGRFYIPSYSGRFQDMLILWHPRLNAAIGSEHIDSDAVTALDLNTAALTSLVFGEGSIEEPEILDETIDNVDIEKNQLTSHSIAEEIFNSTHFENESITSPKFADSSVDSRVVLDLSLGDDDFATDSIDSEALGEGSVGAEEVHPLAVVADKLSRESISLSKLASDSVIGEDIVSGEIQPADIADLSMGNSSFQTLVILSRHVLDGEIRSDHLQNDSITRIKIRSHTLEEDVFSTSAFNQSTMIRDENIFSYHFQEKSITQIKISTLPSELLINSRFQDNAVTSSDLATAAISESDINTEAIGLSHIASQVLEDRSFDNGAIQTHHFQDGLLTHFQFANQTLQTSDFADHSLFDLQFATDAIRDQHFINGSLHSDDFKDKSIGADLLPDSIDSSQILAKSLTSADFADNSLTTHVFGAAVVLSEHLTSSTLTNLKFSSSQITEKKFIPDSIITADLNSGSVDKDRILSHTLDNDHLIVNNLSGTLLENLTLEGRHFKDSTIPSSKIASAVLQGDSIAPFQVLTAHIKDSQVQSRHITDLAITQTKLAPREVFGSEQILDGSILGTSILSFSLYNEDISTDSIRDDLIQSDVINQLRDLNLSGSVYDATTTSLNKVIGEVIEVSDSSSNTLYYLFRQNQNIIESTVDFSSYTNLGTVPCTKLEDIAFLSQIEGYAVCSDRSLYFTESSAANWAKVTEVPEAVLDIHFFDLNNSVMMTRSGSDETIWHSTNSGKNWSRKVGPLSSLLPWTRFQDSVAVPSQQETTFAKVYYSTSQGSVFNSVTLDDGVTTSSTIYGLSFVRDGAELWGVVDRDGTWDVTKLLSFGDTLESKTPAALQTAFQNSSPTMQPIEFHDRLYFFTEDSSYGVFVYDIDANDMSQILPSLIITRDSSISEVDVLQSPVHLGDHKILYRGASSIAHTWEPNSFDHVLVSGLTDSSMGSSVLSSTHFKRGSIGDTPFQLASIDPDHFQSKGFTHGEYLQKTQKEQAFPNLHYSNDTNTLYLATASQLYQSTDEGATLASIYTPADTLAGIHSRGDVLLIGSQEDKLALSFDKGASFTRITSTPFNSQARAGYVHHSERILAFGVNDSNQLIPALYDADLGTFLQMRNTSLENVSVVSGSPGLYPVQVDFVDGKNGYLGVYQPGGGDYFFKTQDGGYSWAAVATSSSSQIPHFQIMEDGEFWLGFGSSLQRYVSDSLNSIAIIPDGSSLRGIHFFNSEVGLLITTTAAWITYDGAASLSRFQVLTNPPTSITQLNNRKVLFSGTNLNLQLLEPQGSHQPFASLDSSVFSTANPLRSIHFVYEGMNDTKMASQALQSEHIEDQTLEANRIASGAINTSHIESNSLDRHLFALESLTTAKFDSDGVHGNNLRLGILDTNHIIDGTITGAELADSILDSDAITDGSLTTDLIQDNSFFGSVLSSEQILSRHLKDGSFSHTEFASGIFEQKHLLENSFNATHLSSPGFDLENEKLVLRALTENSLNTSQISSFLIEDRSLYAYLVATGTITTSKLKDQAVSEEKWRDDSITSRLFATGIIDSSHTKNRELSGTHFLASTLSRAKFSNTSIPASNLSSYSFAAREFNTGSIIAGKLSTTSGSLVTDSKVESAVITSGTLDGTFATSYFGADSFTESKFQTGAITLSELGSQILTEGHFSPLGLLGEDFGDDSITRAKLLTYAGFAFAISKGAVQGTNLQSHVLTNSEFSTGIESSKIADQVLFSSQIGTLDPTQIKDHSISERVLELEGLISSAVGNGAIQTAHFQSGGIYSGSLADDVIILSNTNNAILTSHQIKDFSIKGEDFAELIPGSKLASQTLTGREFVDEFLFGSALTSSTLTEGKISTATLSSREILKNTLEAANLAGNSFYNSAFSTAELTSSDFGSRVISSTHITDQSINSAQIGTEEITGNHLDALTVNEDHFQSQSIGSTRIASRNTTKDKLGAIPQDRFDSSAITLAKLSLNEKIPASKFRKDSILASSVNTGAVQSTHLIAESILGSQFSTGIHGDRITSHVIDPTLLSSFGFTSNWIEDGTITQRVLGNGILTDEHFASSSIETTGIENLTIPLSAFASFVLTAGNIQNDSLVSADFQADSLDGSHINSASLTGDVLNLGDVDGSGIEDGSLLWDHLDDGALFSVHLQNLVISREHIANSTVSLSLVTSEVDTSHILDGSLTGSEFSTAIPGSKFKTHSIAGDRFQSAVIATSKFPGEIPRIKLKSDTISLNRFNTTTTLFTNNSLIKSNSVTGGDFQTNTISGDTISKRTFQSGDLSELLTSGVIPSQEVTANKIQDLAISGTVLYVNDTDSSDSKLLNHEQLADNIVDSTAIPAGAIHKSHLDTSETDFQKLMNLGSGDTVEHADFLHIHNRPELSCPTNYTNLSGTLEYCIRSTDLTSNPEDSVESCALDGGVQGHVCNFQEYISACNADEGSLNLNNGSTYLTSNYSASKVLGFQPPTSGCQYMSNPVVFNYSSGANNKFRCCVNN